MEDAATELVLNKSGAAVSKNYLHVSIKWRPLGQQLWKLFVDDERKLGENIGSGIG